MARFRSNPSPQPLAFQETSMVPYTSSTPVVRDRFSEMDFYTSPSPSVVQLPYDDYDDQEDGEWVRRRCRRSKGWDDGLISDEPSVGLKLFKGMLVGSVIAAVGVYAYRKYQSGKDDEAQSIDEDDVVPSDDDDGVIIPDEAAPPEGGGSDGGSGGGTDGGGSDGGSGGGTDGGGSDGGSGGGTAPTDDSVAAEVSFATGYTGGAAIHRDGRPNTTKLGVSIYRMVNGSPSAQPIASLPSVDLPSGNGNADARWPLTVSITSPSGAFSKVSVYVARATVADSEMNEVEVLAMTASQDGTLMDAGLVYGSPDEDPTSTLFPPPPSGAQYAFVGKTEGEGPNATETYWITSDQATTTQDFFVRIFQV